MLDEFDAEDATGESYQADYNVAPTVTVRTVVNRPPREEGKEYDPQAPPIRQLRLARWGLVPSWAKDLSVGSRMFNARAESINAKPAFRTAFTKRRCLVPADGWYEWLRTTDANGKPRKQPYLMTPVDGRSLAFAGLYEFWRPKGSEQDLLLSVTVITVASQGDLAEIHDRMPLVLAHSDWQRWLDPTVAEPSELLIPQDESAREHLELRPVSELVNSVKNNAPQLLDPADPIPAAQELF